MILLCHWLRLLPALLLAVVFAAGSVAAEPLVRTDASYSVPDNSAYAPKLIDHASRKLRHTANLEEFFEIDDDAEQYFKPQAIFARDTVGSVRVARTRSLFYCCPPPTHRACAFFATGPPHA